MGRDALATDLAATAHHNDPLLVLVEIRPHVRTALAAGLASESRLDIGQPDIIGPLSPLIAMERPQR